MEGLKNPCSFLGSWNIIFPPKVDIEAIFYCLNFYPIFEHRHTYPSCFRQSPSFLYISLLWMELYVSSFFIIPPTLFESSLPLLKVTVSGIVPSCLVLCALLFLHSLNLVDLFFSYYFLFLFCSQLRVQNALLLFILDFLKLSGVSMNKTNISYYFYNKRKKKKGKRNR